MDKNKRLLPKIILGFLSLLVAVLGMGVIHVYSQKPAPLTGRELAAMPLQTLNNGIKNFGHIKQETALIVTFASWCPSCREEQPFLMELKAEGVPLYGLAWLDEDAKTAAFLNEMGNPFIWTYTDNKGEATRPLGISGTPETFVVKNGYIIFKYAGPITPKIWNDVLKPMMG